MNIVASKSQRLKSGEKKKTWPFFFLHHHQSEGSSLQKIRCRAQNVANTYLNTIRAPQTLIRHSSHAGNTFASTPATDKRTSFQWRSLLFCRSTLRHATWHFSAHCCHPSLLTCFWQYGYTQHFSVCTQTSSTPRQSSHCSWTGIGSVVTCANIDPGIIPRTPSTGTFCLQ